jgi:osmotically-inducible protein OsmY
MSPAVCALLVLCFAVPQADDPSGRDDAALDAAVRRAIESNPPDAVGSNSTLSARRADLLLARDVLDAVSGTGMAGTFVGASGGVVELRGRVTDAAHAAAVIEAASAVPGVVSIRDRLSFDGADAGRAGAASAPRDTPLLVVEPAGSGPLSFLTRSGLAGRDLSLNVRDGIVDVSGAVNAEAARQHVLMAAQTVPGVRAVRAQLDVRVSEPDAERRLAILVRRRLQYDVVVQGVMPAVTVYADRGVIRLEGRVRDETQRRRAVQLAGEGLLVFGVQDRLVVDPRLVVPSSRP